MHTIPEVVTVPDDEMTVELQELDPTLFGSVMPSS